MTSLTSFAIKICNCAKTVAYDSNCSVKPPCEIELRYRKVTGISVLISPISQRKICHRVTPKLQEI